MSESASEIIQLTQPITLSRSDDSNDNAYVINRPVTITGEALSLERAGIVLGADVTFENITLCFNTSVRNAIIANGYSLTLNNVSSGGTYAIDLFCGELTDYTGGNEIPQSGSNGIITIKGNNSIGSNIYAGSLSDIGYTDENRDLCEDKPNTYSGNSSIILEKTATGGNHNATFIYKDVGNGYVCEPTLNNVDKITLLPSDNGAITYLSPNTTQTAFNTLSVPANTRLSLVNMASQLSASSFEGGGELIFADNNQKIDLNTASGTTQIAVGGVDSYGTGSSGTIDTDWTCITVTNIESEGEFILMPNINTPNIILKKIIMEIGQHN